MATVTIVTLLQDGKYPSRLKKGDRCKVILRGVAGHKWLVQSLETGEQAMLRATQFELVGEETNDGQ